MGGKEAKKLLQKEEKKGDETEQRRKERTKWRNEGKDLQIFSCFIQFVPLVGNVRGKKEERKRKQRRIRQKETYITIKKRIESIS